MLALKLFSSTRYSTFKFVDGFTKIKNVNGKMDFGYYTLYISGIINCRFEKQKRTVKNKRYIVTI